MGDEDVEERAKLPMAPESLDRVPLHDECFESYVTVNSQGLHVLIDATIGSRRSEVKIAASHSGREQTQPDLSRKKRTVDIYYDTFKA